MDAVAVGVSVSRSGGRDTGTGHVTQGVTQLMGYVTHEHDPMSRIPSGTLRDTNPITRVGVSRIPRHPSLTVTLHDDGTEDWDTCPACGGDWLKCDCTLEEADAAYQSEVPHV